MLQFIYRILKKSVCLQYLLVHVSSYINDNYYCISYQTASLRLVFRQHPWQWAVWTESSSHGDWTNIRHTGLCVFNTVINSHVITSKLPALFCALESYLPLHWDFLSSAHFFLKLLKYSLILFLIRFVKNIFSQKFFIAWRHTTTYKLL